MNRLSWAQHEVEQLCPCRLCGGKAEIKKISVSDGQCHYDDWKVYCTVCGCTFTYAADGYYGRDWITKNEAIAQWNELHHEKESEE